MGLVPVREPYQVVLDGIRLNVAKRVFPPDFGMTARNMAKILGNYSPAAALDMGCGTGFLALVLKRNGASVVFAVDINPLAVACTRENVELNERLKPITVVESDLFEKVDVRQKFDLMVFNQPYFPLRPDDLFGGVPDGGREIIQRFFQQAPKFLNRDSPVIMCFQDTAGTKHDPRAVAEELAFPVRTLYQESDGPINRRIYEIRLPNL